MTHGGSLANLTALLTARNVALGDVWEQGMADGKPRPLLVVHAGAHYSVARAAGILGLGSHQIVPVALDERGRMAPAHLARELTRLRAQGHPLVAVVACACATPMGSFDPLNTIARICRRHGVWLHVDAAHGGATLLSERHRHLLEGIDQADSIVWDAHKMMFVPGLCAFVFYRDRAHRFEAFRQDAPYLFDPAVPGLAEYDSGTRTVECNETATAALRSVGVWSLFGPDCSPTWSMSPSLHAKSFSASCVEAPDFAPLHEPEANIVVFRHIPAEFARGVSGRLLGAFQLEPAAPHRVGPSSPSCPRSTRAWARCGVNHHQPADHSCTPRRAAGGTAPPWAAVCWRSKAHRVVRTQARRGDSLSS